jgi:plastocyanin
MGVCRAVTVTALAALGFAGVAVAGELRGVVRLDGAVPEPTTFTISSTSEGHPIDGCGAITKRSPRLLVDPQGGVQNAVVWVESPMDSREPAEALTSMLDQRECVFEPHVILLPVGGTLAIRNSDPMLHNVRIFQERAMLMHEWQQPHGPDLTWRFDAPGRYVVRCGVHAWMYAWVVVTEHRHHAVTDQVGGFVFSDVPAGHYTVHAWHETLGEHQQVIRVGERQSDVTIRLSQDGRASWE